MLTYTTPTYEHLGKRITITPRVGGGCAAYCDGNLLTIGQNHDEALAAAQEIIAERLRHRSRLRVVESGKMAGLGRPTDEWGEW